MSADLIDLVQRLGQPRVLVVGDLMLDRYVWGDAERISQEAPVILLRAERREERLGGASSVATMLRALGARVSITGVVGADLSGLVTANLDKEAKYRTRMNVLSRPSAQGIEIIGHHEILIPLLHAAVAARLV